MRFETESLGPIGVEIRGLDLRGDVSEADFAWLRRTVTDEGLVLLRDQPMEAARHVALGERFGPPEKLDIKREGPDPSLAVIHNVDREGSAFADDDPLMEMLTINEGWHSDSAFREIPASFTLFAAVVVPDEGGDTLYACLQRAWDALDPEEQVKLYGLNGIHDYSAAFRQRGKEMARLVGFELPALTHPLVRRHPETGRVGLFVSEHMNGIEGMAKEEGKALVEKLVALVTSEDRVYRHRWQVGDLLIWDNRSTLHRAQGFDERYARVMHHVRVSGSEPPIAATAPRTV